MKRIIIVMLAVLSLVSCLKSFEDTSFVPEKAVMSWSGSPEGPMIADAATFEVNLSSNLPWRISACPTWATVTPKSGLGNEKITISIQRNRTIEQRRGVIRASVTSDQYCELELVQDGSSSGGSMTYYVKPGGAGEKTGLSWANATTLAGAIDLVADGDTILVAAGTYYPETVLTGSDVADESNKTFEIHSNFALLGGFPANADDGATTIADRDPSVNVTTLSGAMENSSAYHVVIVTASRIEGKWATISGFTITGGNAAATDAEVLWPVGGVSYSTSHGGGLVVGPAEVHINDCIITANESRNHAGGVFLKQNGLTKMENVRISNNTCAINGGGLWNCGTTLYMNNCTVSDNISGAQAAGFYSIDSGGCASVSRIYNSTFSGNDCTTVQASRSGGGAYIREYSDCVFVGCTFSGNKAGNGGAVQGYGANGKASRLTLISCTVVGNHADLLGGGISYWNTFNTTDIYNCIISGNDAPNGPDLGIGSNVTTDPNLSYTTTILGNALYTATGVPSGSWTFNATTMLGAFGFNGGVTMTYPLVDIETNPACSQGMSVSQLVSVGSSLSPAVDPSIFNKDQRGKDRTTDYIGSCTK